jgi:hypothetical protein
MPLDFCTYENRAEDLVGLKLLVLSLARAMPDARLHVPTGDIPDEALDWLRQRPNVTLHAFAPRGGFWHVKPSVIAHVLNSGANPVCWIDADIFVTRDVTDLLEAATPDAVVVAEEPFRTQPLSPDRIAEALALPRAKPRGFAVNSCVLRVSDRHMPLLEAWEEATRAQPQAVEELGLGDQDVLAALLETARFAPLPVRRLRSGYDIVHCWLPVDYSLGERLSTLWRGEPGLLHTQQAKPWRRVGPGTRGPGDRQPYLLAARALAGSLDANDTEWRPPPPSAATRALGRLLGRRFSLYGLAYGAEGTLRRVYGRAKRMIAGRYR